MLTLFTLALLCSHFRSGAPAQSKAPSPFTEKFFTQTLDHFNYNSYNGTFEQRYLITDRFWQRGHGPLFFYTGNEGDIWEFALNSDFILELAAQQGALVIFAEHRFYGNSLPFGFSSLRPPLVGLLTVEQALADYALMIRDLKQQLGAAACPVIAFGGSYGGMLAAYMRVRYPQQVAGALAASAPVLSTAGRGDSGQFFRDVTADFEHVSPACPAAVRAAFQQLQDLGNRGDYSGIGAEMSLCGPPSSPQGVRQLLLLLRNAFTLMAMLDYPYSTSFMGGMPAHPVQTACSTMLSGPDLLHNLRDTAGIVYNSSGLLSCFDLWGLYVDCADPTGCGLGPNSQAWDYQACTEVELCFDSSNLTDMFPRLSFSQQQRSSYCSQHWGVPSRPGWLGLQFSEEDFSRAGNIIFSNGDLDPWANGGVRKSLSSTVIAINIAEGAHHLDLRGSNPADPDSVVRARRLEAETISRWVEEERGRLRG